MQPAAKKSAHPLIISAGLNGSGSTWVFNVIVEILRRNDPACQIRTAFSARFLEDVSVGDADTMVIKTHTLEPAVGTLARLARVPIILTVRDPKDGVASLMTRFGLAYEHALENVRVSADALTSLADTSGVFTLRYEDGFTKDPETIDKLANLLAVTLSRKNRDAIWRGLTPKAVRATIAKLASEGAFADGPASLTFDPGTHWHPSHVGDGLVETWRAVLSAQQASGVDRETSAFCVAFGYTVGEAVVEGADQTSYEAEGTTRARDVASGEVVQNDAMSAANASRLEALEVDRASRILATESLQNELDRERAERLELIQRLNGELALRQSQLDAVTETDVRRVEELEAAQAAREAVIEELHNQLGELALDRTEKQDVIQRLSGELDLRQKRLEAMTETNARRFEELETDRAARGMVIEGLQRHMDELDKDRANKLEAIERLTGELNLSRRRLGELADVSAVQAEASEADRVALGATIAGLQSQLLVVDRDRAARLEVIEQLTGDLGRRSRDIEDLNADRVARGAIIDQLQDALRALEDDWSQRGDVINTLDRAFRECLERSKNLDDRVVADQTLIESCQTTIRTLGQDVAGLKALAAQRSDAIAAWEIEGARLQVALESALEDIVMLRRTWVAKLRARIKNR